MALKENSRKVFDYVKAHDGEDFTAKDIAAALDLAVQSVNGIVTSAFQRKGLMERVPAEIELEDGSHKAIKLIKLTEEGKSWVPVTSDE